jgi:hypothetical protein
MDQKRQATGLAIQEHFCIANHLRVINTIEKQKALMRTTVNMYGCNILMQVWGGANERLR